MLKAKPDLGLLSGVHACQWITGNKTRDGWPIARASAHLFSTLLTERRPPLVLQSDLLNWTYREQHEWLQLKSKLASMEPPSFPGSNFRLVLSGGCSPQWRLRSPQNTPPASHAPRRSNLLLVHFPDASVKWQKVRGGGLQSPHFM